MGVICSVAIKTPSRFAAQIDLPLFRGRMEPQPAAFGIASAGRFSSRAPIVSTISCPSAMKSALRGDVCRQARPIGAAGLRRRKAQELHALVAHLDVDGDLRHQRDAVAVGDHLHHRRKARRAEAERISLPRHRRNRRAPGRAGNGLPRAGSAAADRCRAARDARRLRTRIVGRHREQERVVEQRHRFRFRRPRTGSASITTSRLAARQARRSAPWSASRAVRSADRG